MKKYNVLRILNDDDIELVKSASRDLDWHTIHQFANLFHCDRAILPNTNYFPSISKKLDQYVSTERPDLKLKHTSSYLLNYVPGSFTRMHCDENTHFTFITMIDSVNLVGGESLVQQVYEARGRRAEHHVQRNGSEQQHPPYGKDIIFEVVNLQDGETMVCSEQTKHGVARVKSGSRLVLIDWYVREDYERNAGD